MSDIDAAHYSNLIFGGLIWVVLFAALAIGVIAKTLPTKRRVDAPSTATVSGPRPAWVGPALISLLVTFFFSAAPFAVYGSGPSPSPMGVSMVVAGQVGYATSFLLFGLLTMGVGRMFGLRGRATATFATGTAIGVGLAVLSASMGHHSWLLAPP